MSLTPKQKIIKDFAINPKDTGSPAVQIAVLTSRISNLSTHLKTNKHDESSKRGLMLMVGQRRRLLNYVKRNSVENYQAIVKKLGLRS
jgi:small subunit ribosomal protein S15